MIRSSVLHSDASVASLDSCSTASTMLCPVMPTGQTMQSFATGARESVAREEPTANTSVDTICKRNHTNLHEPVLTARTLPSRVNFSEDSAQPACLFVTYQLFLFGLDKSHKISQIPPIKNLRFTYWANQVPIQQACSLIDGALVRSSASRCPNYCLLFQSFLQPGGVSLCFPV